MDTKEIESKFGVIFLDNIGVVLSEYETRIIHKNEQDIWAYVNNSALDQLSIKTRYIT